jgi:hypothetical protein
MRFMVLQARAGFTTLELVVVLMLMAAVLLIATPNLIRWYSVQQFYQSVQQVMTLFRVAEFSAITANAWMAVVLHSDCPFARGRICAQRIRLPMGQCGIVGTWPAWTNLTSCGTQSSPTEMCEYVQDRWPAAGPEGVRRVEQIRPEFSGTLVLIIGPNGSISQQTSPATSPPLCSDLPILPPGPQVVLSYPAYSPRYYQGVCLSARGQIALTDSAPSRDQLGCPF